MPAFFEKKSTMPPSHALAPTSALCLSTPVPKGAALLCFPCESRGMERTREAPSNEAPHVLLGYHQGRLMTYLHKKLLLTLSNLSFCFHGGSMIPPRNLSSVSHVRQPLSAAARFLQSCANNVEQYFSTDSATFPFHHHFSWELS